MFTQQTTTGYTDEQLAALNAERAEYLSGYEAGTDDYEQADKAFSDIISRR